MYTNTTTNLANKNILWYSLFMNRINVPIKKVGEKTTFMETTTRPKWMVLFALIMSSVLLGAITERRYTFLRFPNVDPSIQLGLVVDSLPSNTSSAVVPSGNSSKASEASSSSIATNARDIAPLLAAETNASLERSDDLYVLITLHRDAIAELNLELELIKNRSVSLIVEFDQNCGNWKDECATPFTKELETNNSRYSQLVAKLATLNQELAKAESERNALTQ